MLLVYFQFTGCFPPLSTPLTRDDRNFTAGPTQGFGFQPSHRLSRPRFIPTWGTFSRYKVKRYLHKSEKEMSQKEVHLTPKFAFSSPPVRIPKTVQFLCTDSGLNTLAWTYLLIVMEMTGKQYQYFQLYNFISLIDLLEPEPLNFASSF